MELNDATPLTPISAKNETLISNQHKSIISEEKKNTDACERSIQLGLKKQKINDSKLQHFNAKFTQHNFGFRIKCKITVKQHSQKHFKKILQKCRETTKRANVLYCTQSH